MIDGISSGYSEPIRPSPGSSSKRATTPEEAARQFEQILVKQLVQSMTSGLFNSPLSGDDGPQWMEAQADLQRDVLNDALADHLVQSGSLRLAELLLRQWNRTSDSSATADL